MRETIEKDVLWKEGVWNIEKKLLCFKWNFGRVWMTRVTEAVVQRCSIKNVFLEISNNSHENTCARVSFLIKLQLSGLQLY